MITTFKVKSYKQLEFLPGAVNALLMAGLLLVGCLGVLSSGDRHWLDTVITNLAGTKIVGIVPLGALAIFWAWAATQLLRLHDRLYDPIYL